MAVSRFTISPPIWYLSSRAVSAAGNLVAAAVFTRLAGAGEYGHYVLIYAWSLIVYGFSTQWTRFAYFGTYGVNVDEYIASLVRLLSFALVALTALAMAAAFTGLYDARFLLAILGLVASMTVYEAACEVARSLLKVQAAALSVMLRTLLNITLGSVVLVNGGDATDLALAIAAAHAVAAVPCFIALRTMELSQASRTALLRMLKYGWPLVLSFGVNAIGHSIDRLLLAYFAGSSTLGPYGVLADVLRQSFTVFGEGIALSSIAIAKVQINSGDHEAARQTLRNAFNGCLAAGAFGIAFFVVFGEIVTRLVLGQQFVELGRELIPILAVAFAFNLMRNFYFAQVIYFTQASYLELIVSTIFVVISGALSMVLIPQFGARGAAIGLMVACIVSCAAFALIGRLHYRLPIDLNGLYAIPVLAALFVGCAWGIGLNWPRTGVVIGIEALVFVVTGLFVAYRFRLLHTATVAATIDRPSAH